MSFSNLKLVHSFPLHLKQNPDSNLVSWALPTTPALHQDPLCLACWVSLDLHSKDSVQTVLFV